MNAAPVCGTLPAARSIFLRLCTAGHDFASPAATPLRTLLPFINSLPLRPARRLPPFALAVRHRTISLRLLALSTGFHVVPSLSSYCISGYPVYGENVFLDFWAFAGFRAGSLGYFEMKLSSDESGWDRSMEAV